MAEARAATPPSWLFAALAVGSLLTSGVYLGKMRIIGASGGDVLRAALFGALGILWMVVCKRMWGSERESA